MKKPTVLAVAALAAVVAIAVGLLIDGRQDETVINLTLTSEDATRLARGEIATPGPEVLATAEAEFAGTATAAP